MEGDLEESFSPGAGQEVTLEDTARTIYDLPATNQGQTGYDTSSYANIDADKQPPSVPENGEYQVSLEVARGNHHSSYTTPGGVRVLKNGEVVAEYPVTYEDGTDYGDGIYITRRVDVGECTPEDVIEIQAKKGSSSWYEDTYIREVFLQTLPATKQYGIYGLDYSPAVPDWTDLGASLIAPTTGKYLVSFDLRDRDSGEVEIRVNGTSQQAVSNTEEWKEYYMDLEENDEVTWWGRNKSASDHLRIEDPGMYLDDYEATPFTSEVSAVEVTDVYGEEREIDHLTSATSIQQGGTTEFIGQEFSVSVDAKITGADLSLRKGSNPGTGNTYRVRLRSGGVEGTLVAESASLNVDDLTTELQIIRVDFDVEVTAGTYALVVEAESGDNDQVVSWSYNSSGTIPGGYAQWNISGGASGNTNYDYNMALYKETTTTVTRVTLEDDIDTAFNDRSTATYNIYDNRLLIENSVYVQGGASSSVGAVFSELNAITTTGGKPTFSTTEQMENDAEILSLDNTNNKVIAQVAGVLLINFVFGYYVSNGEYYGEIRKNGVKIPGAYAGGYYNNDESDVLDDTITVTCVTTVDVGDEIEFYLGRNSSTNYRKYANTARSGHFNVVKIN
jgi:hypothetical protein